MPVRTGAPRTPTPRAACRVCAATCRTTPCCGTASRCCRTPGFDVCAETEFDDLEAMDAAFASEQYQGAIVADELKLIDKARFTHALCERRVVREAGGPVKLMTFLRGDARSRRRRAADRAPRLPRGAAGGAVRRRRDPLVRRRGRRARARLPPSTRVSSPSRIGSCEIQTDGWLKSRPEGSTLRAMPTSAATTRDATRVLFTPFDLAGLRLKNRLIMAPMGTCLDEGGHITDATIAYYRRRAEGGVGTITVEGVPRLRRDRGSRAQDQRPRVPAGPEAARRRAARVRHHDRRAADAPGPPGRARPDGRAVAGAAELARADPARADRAPRSRDIVEDYAKAADLAREAGFDFVEVHGAHGYLPSNFLSPLDNRRSDAYGGSLENRARFSLEVARAIMAAVPELPLVWRINGDDGMPGGLTIDETRRGLAVAGRRPASRRSASPPAPGTRCT